MTSFLISGNRKLSGELSIHGAKNAALPILTASILHQGTMIFHQCPDILDVRYTLRMLNAAGCVVLRDQDTVIVNASNVHKCDFPADCAAKLRSSILFLGAALGRCGEITLDYPGGCTIGSRPIDIHLDALRQMGAKITESDGKIYCRAYKLTGCRIRLPYPSVGATENIMMAATLADGVTVIENAAREPEIMDLGGFLEAAGVLVKGAGTETVSIIGQKKLKDTEYLIMPDRIVAGTYLSAVAAAGGEIELTNINEDDISALLIVLKQAGCEVCVKAPEGIYLKAPERLHAVRNIHTEPFPGFPTDMQSQIMAALSKADGISRIHEHIFEDRCNIAPELLKMGADIRIEKNHTAVIRGVEKLQGAATAARDLRGGAALVIAGLAAEGDTIVENAIFIDRGYQDICGDLKKLGADIRHT